MKREGERRREKEWYGENRRVKAREGEIMREGESKRENERARERRREHEREKERKD